MDNKQFLFMKTKNGPIVQYNTDNIGAVTLYFELLDNNITVTCIESDKYVKLTWENLNGLGSPEQKISINKFRLQYVDNLKKNIECCSKNICNKESYCKLIGVGTIENIGPASDIDMNLIFDFNKKTADKIIYTIIKLYKNISKFHYKKFTTSFEDLFDINIYAINLYSKECNNNKCEIKNCSKKLCAITSYNLCNQRKLAFYRAAEVIQRRKLRIPEKIQILYNDTIKLIKNKTKLPLTNYVNEIKKSYTFLNVTNTKTKIDLNSFSNGKINERETYRSAGAFLHIVANRRDLSADLYIDSLLDNYGFLLENLYHQPTCFKLDIKIKLLRVAKYLERMCDAIILYFENTYGIYSNNNKKYHYIHDLYNDITEIYSCSRIINNNRKQNIDSSNELIKLDNLIKKLKNNNIEEDANVWFNHITSIFDNIDLKYNNSIKKIHILGRSRKITIINHKKYIIYKNEKILLSDAHKLDKLKKTKSQVSRNPQ
jgi:hypothetical protein